jgi:hypothetical protein
LLKDPKKLPSSEIGCSRDTIDISDRLGIS